MELFDTWWAIIRDGLNHINPIQGLIIGLLAGFAASTVAGVVFGALGASIVYVLVDLIKPVLFDHKAFQLPVFNTAFWHFFLALYFAFLVIVALIYVVRSIIAAARG